MTRSKSMFGRDLGDWETKQYSDMGATGKDRIDSTYDNGTAIYHLVAHDWIVSASEQHRVEDFTISAKAKRKTRFTSDTTDTDNADDATISSGARACHALS